MHGRMNLYGCLIALFVILLAGCDQAGVAPVDGAGEQQALENGDVIPGEYIVVMNRDVVGKNSGAAIAALTAREDVEAGFVYQNVISGFSARLSPEAHDALERDERVAYVEPDRMFVLGLCDRNPSHPKCQDNGGGGGGSNQTTPWGITRVGGPATGFSGKAYVIDTGIDFSHADLNVNPGCSANFVTRGKDSPEDGNGHGTHVAGTIAAIDNDIDVVGVAPGAVLCAVRVLDNSGSGSYSAVIAGIDYVGANGNSGDAANMSLGGSFSQAVNDAVESAAANGIRFALAAGNEGSDAANTSPASASGTNIYTISAVDQNDCLASWSNYGAPVDFAAPGVGILSTKKGGGTTTMSGTSMATPHVTGLLLFGPPKGDGTVSCDPDNTHEQVAHR